MSKDLSAALQKLTADAAGKTTRKDKVLSSGKSTNAIPDRVGSAGPAASTGGGIASPLTETNYSDRTYWTDVNITSTDGFITFVHSPIKQMSFTDANGDNVVIDYKSP